MDKDILNRIKDKINDIANTQLEQKVDVIADYYNNNRDYYEIVTLKSEKEKDINIKIPTNISIEHDKEELQINVSISPASNDGKKAQVESRILKAQNIGTGGIIQDKEVLDYFGVKEQIKKTDGTIQLHDRYFNPKSMYIRLKEDLKIKLGGKKK